MRPRAFLILSSISFSVAAHAQPSPSVAPATPPASDGAFPPAIETSPAPAPPPDDAAPPPVLVIPPNPTPEPTKPPPSEPPAQPLPTTPPAARDAPSLPPMKHDEADDEAAGAPVELGAPRDLGLELGVLALGRLGSAANYASDRGFGVGYGLGLWMNVSPRIALGLELAHADLGRGSAASGQNLVDSEFSATALSLSGRFFPWQSSSVRLFLALEAGLVVEHVDAAGVRQVGAPLAPATAFDCSGTSSPDLGLGAGLGAIFRLNSRIDLVPRVELRSDRLTSGEVDGCATGLGSTASLGVGVGVAYGFDGPSSAGL